MIQFASQFARGESFIHLESMLDDMDEESVMVPVDDEEHRVIDCWTLSIKSGFNSAELDSDIVALFCDRYELDRLEVLRVCKSMTTAFNAVNAKRK